MVEVVFAMILVVILMICVFILGGVFARNLILDALDEARRQRHAEDSYRMAGVRTMSDPKPYIPPTIRPKTPRAKTLPHMNTLDRLLHERKRGTIIVRAGDHRKRGANTTSPLKP